MAKISKLKPKSCRRDFFGHDCSATLTKRLERDRVKTRRANPNSVPNLCALRQPQTPTRGTTTTPNQIAGRLFGLRLMGNQLGQALLPLIFCSHFLSRGGIRCAARWRTHLTPPRSLVDCDSTHQRRTSSVLLWHPSWVVCGWHVCAFVYTYGTELGKARLFWFILDKNCTKTWRKLGKCTAKPELKATICHDRHTHLTKT